jgi:hypothetical protein
MSSLSSIDIAFTLSSVNPNLAALFTSSGLGAVSILPNPPCSGAACF